MNDMGLCMSQDGACIVSLLHEGKEGKDFARSNRYTLGGGIGGSTGGLFTVGRWVVALKLGL
jgi:hypothetical protein